MLVEGIVCPVGIVNQRGWGISDDDVDSLISSLMKKPIRMPFSRDDEHVVDFLQDTRSEIGKPLKIWREGNNIKAIAEIKDSIAKQKLEDGVWEKRWSVAGYGKKRDNGLTDGNGFHALGLTLVNKGAWDESQFDIVAASADDGKNDFLYGNFEQFNVFYTGDKMVETKSEIDYDALVASKDQEIADLKAKNDELAASISEYSKQLEGMIPQSMAEKLAASKAEEAIKAFSASMEKKVAVEKYEKLMASVNMEITADERAFLDGMNAEQITGMINKFESLSASSNAIYEKKNKKEPVVESILTLGRFEEGKWVTE